MKKAVSSAKKCVENHEFVLGDWVGDKSSELTPKEFIRDFYLIKALTVTVFAQDIVKKENRIWREKLTKYTEAFKDRYIDGSGRCTVDSQCAVSMMITSGLYDDKKVMCDQLISVICRDEVRLTCGMVGVQYLYDALSVCGRADLAYKIITESVPGYRSWFESGSTTLWEKWDGADHGSHNHHMFSGVIAWFYKSLLGIAPNVSHPAFEEIELNPAFIKELGYAKGSTLTVHGKISAEWRYENGSFTYTVDIPSGIRALFRGEELKEGRNVFTVSSE